MKKYGREVVLSMTGGSRIRNLDDEHSDEDLKYFVLPSFEDLYSGKVFTKFETTDEVDIDVQDVRRLEKLLFNSNPAYLDLLFARDIDPHGFNNIKDIVNMRDDIARMNLPVLCSASLGMYDRAIKDMMKGTSEKVKEVIATYGYNTKKAMLAMHFLLTLEKYHKSGFNNYGESIWYEGVDRDFMIGMKRGKFSLIEVNQILSKQLLIVKGLEQDYKAQPVDEETNRNLQIALRELVKRELK